MGFEAENAPTNNEANGAPESAEGSNEQAVQDIDAYAEFKFQGKSYTPEKLASFFREYEQTSQVANQYRDYDKYLNNITIDIETVLQDPKLADQFKATYPKQFHALLDRELKRQGSQAASEPSQQSNGVPKEVLSKISQLESKLTEYEREKYALAVEKSEAYLQKTVDPLFAKYDYANQDAVYAKAEALIAQGYQMTEAAWERLIKENHQAIQKSVETKHQAKLKEQLEKGQRGQDIGAGGSPVGNAPKKAKSFAEATEQMIQHVRGR